MRSKARAAALLALLAIVPAHAGADPAPPVGAYPGRRPLNVATPPAGKPLYPLADRGSIDDFAFGKFRLARDGALEFNYGRARENAGWQFNPVATSGYCLTAYNEFVRTGRPEARTAMQRAAYALRRRAQASGSGLMWRYAFAGDYGARPGWISGMAQGNVMGCLTAVGTLNRDPLLQAAAYRAFMVLVAPFGDHGTSSRVGNGVFYEEVAGKGSYPAHVLNGMIYALGGLWLSNELDPRREYSAALWSGIRGVRSVLGSYLVPGASLYDLGPRAVAAMGAYNWLHASQLEWLGSVSGDPAFHAAALRVIQFERAIPYRARTHAWVPGHGVEKLAGDGNFFAGPRKQTVVIDFSFGQPTMIDEVRIAAKKSEWAPYSITVLSGETSTVVRPTGRFLSVALPPRTVSSLRIIFRPKPSSLVGLSLLSFASPRSRSLSALSSELFRHPSPDFYRDAEAAWGSDLARPWLLLDLGDAGDSAFIPMGCFSRAEEVGWSASPDLSAWSAVVPSRVNAPVLAPPGARFVLLQWVDAPACLSGIRGAGAQEAGDSVQAALEIPDQSDSQLFPMRRV